MAQAYPRPEAGMSTTEPVTPRPFGSKPHDQDRLTLSLALRAILYREGVVDSPELPRLAPARRAAGAAGRGGDGERGHSPKEAA
jgi:hypothetical protein